MGRGNSREGGGVPMMMDWHLKGGERLPLPDGVVRRRRVDELPVVRVARPDAEDGGEAQGGSGGRKGGARRAQEGRKGGARGAQEGRTS